jgi:hydrogenase maturation factor
MRKSKQIYDEVFKELLNEFEIKGIEERPRSLDEIETMAEKFTNEFERRIIEKITQEQRENMDKKKAVKNADQVLRTSGYGKKK